MTDYNRAVPAYNEPVDRGGIAHRVPVRTTGPLFDSMDIVAGIVGAIMLLGPLAAAAFWVPYY